MIKSANDTNKKDNTNDQGTNNSSQTCVKTVLHNHYDHEHITERALHNSGWWYEHPSTLPHICVSNKDKLSYLNHAHPCMTHVRDILMDTVFSPVESLQEQYDSYTVTECLLNLEISKYSAIWAVNHLIMAYGIQFQDIMKMTYYKVYMKELNIKLPVQVKNIYYNYLFTSRTIVSYRFSIC